MPGGLDFTSALYLGLRHPYSELASWDALTLGKPAALEVAATNRLLARRLADLTGGEDAVLGSSTLHLFLDLYELLSKDPRVVFVADGRLYPIGRWGLDRARAQGRDVRWFEHHDPLSLRRALARRPGRPVIVTDGFCPACGREAPLREYVAVARRFGGRLLVDDAQALGVLGPRGAGTCVKQGVLGEEVVQVSSLAKGFGAPLAVCSGGRELVEQLRSEGLTQVHCSPPSAASVAAGLRALEINDVEGDRLRAWLAMLIRRFRSRVGSAGIHLHGGSFPMQTYAGEDAVQLNERLQEQGIQTVLHRPRKESLPCVSFLLSAAHGVKEIETAARAVVKTIGKAAPIRRNISNASMAISV